MEVGTVARIANLKAAPYLNGQLCQVLRPAEAPDRVIVQTRIGEKSVKCTNLLSGNAVYPARTGYVAVALSILTSVVVAEVLQRPHGGIALAKAAIPLLGMTWFLMTLGLCFYILWSFRASDAVFPSISELGVPKSTRPIYRVGFIWAAFLIALTVWLYGELLMSNLAEAPPLPTLVAPNASMNTSSETVEVSEASDKTVENLTVSENAGIENSTGNITTRDPNSSIYVWGPERSIKWGYAAAAGIGIQGFFNFDSRVSLRSAFHVVGMGTFVAGMCQHCMLSSLVLTSPRGKPFMDASAMLHRVLKLRRNVTDFAPMVLLLLPLGTQYSTLFRKPLNMNPPSGQPEMPSMRSFLADTGLVSWIARSQWALMLVFAAFFSSYAVDFWVASQMLKLE